MVATPASRSAHPPTPPPVAPPVRIPASPPARIPAAPTTGTDRRTGSFARAALAAAGIASLGTLPTQLLSNESVLIRGDLHFGEAGQGLLVSAAFATAAAASLAITEFGRRYGRRALTLLAASATGVCALGVALAAHSFAVLLVFLCIGGIGNAGLTMAANLSLSATVDAGRQGLGFGVKQSAPPAAALIAGLSVPAVGLCLGWRWTYAALAVAAAVLLLAAARIRETPPSGGGPEPDGAPGKRSAPRSDRLDNAPRTQPAAQTGRTDRTGQADRGPKPGPAPERGLADQQAPRLPLLLTALAMLCANGAATALIAFLPQWAHEAGMPTSAAGFLVASGSCLAIVGRLLAGAAADRRDGRNLPVVAAQIAVGAVGTAALALGTLPTVVAGGLLAFAVGWSWPGLLIFAVVRLGRDRPNSAAAVLQAGAFAGGGLGPLLFGLAVDAAGYPVAWLVTAAGMLLGVLLLVIARRLFAADLRRRPPIVRSA